MFKTFSTGVILGLIAAGAAARFWPLVDLHRESSIVTVQPNGGNEEIFQIQVPADRIVVGGRNTGQAVPSRLSWPDSRSLSGTEVDLFKIRDRENRVVGVASHITAASAAGTVAEWLLYLPARGAMYVPMSPSAGERRVGTLRTGTGEFTKRSGSLSVRFIASADGDGAKGRMELRTVLVSTQADGTGSAAQ